MPSQVLVDVFSGQFELTAAVMSGQIQASAHRLCSPLLLIVLSPAVQLPLHHDQATDFTAMMAFKRSFKFERGAFGEFRQARV